MDFNSDKQPKQSSPTPDSQEPDSTLTQNTTDTEPATQPPKTSRRMIIGLIVAAILAVGGAVFLFVGNADNVPEPPAPIVMPDPDPPVVETRPGVGIPSDRVYADAIDERVHNELVEFAQWAADNKAYAVIGEFGWPRDIDEGGEQWRTVAENWLIDLAQTNMLGYYWATGGGWGGYNLAVHNSEDRLITSINSQAFQLNAFSKDNGLGINMAGLEFGTQLEGYSNENPGTAEDDSYIFNAKANYDFIANEGYTSVRIPFTWERLQPVLKGPLDETYLGYIKDSVSFAEANDMSVVLDLHNYGEYKTAQGTIMLGSTELPHETLVDVWIKLSDAFKDSSAEISYGIMNEPRSLPQAQWNSPAENWEAASQLTVDALRENGDTREIIIGGYNWSKLSTWSRYHDDAWINDPENNTIYEAHHYWDSDTSGTYTGGYR